MKYSVRQHDSYSNAGHLSVSQVIILISCSTKNKVHAWKSRVFHTPLYINMVPCFSNRKIGLRRPCMNEPHLETTRYGR